MYNFTTLGAVAGLAVAIVLIIKKVSPAYSLILGALLGSIIGGGGLVTTVNTMVSGASSMMSSVLSIMTSGILASALIITVILSTMFSKKGNDSIPEEETKEKTNLPGISMPQTNRIFYWIIL